MLNLNMLGVLDFDLIWLMFEINLLIFQIISKLAVLFSENFEKITTNENSIHKSPFPSLPTAILLNLNNLKH
jgi:hypothetical protein